jgi:hypothetical protein
MRKSDVLEEAFPVRCKAVTALGNAADSNQSVDWSALVAECKNIAVLYGRAPAARRWAMFAGAIEIVRLLSEWRNATISAAIDADRFLRAARAQLADLRKQPAESEFERAVYAALAVLDDECALAIGPQLAEAIARIPMPLSIHSDPVPEPAAWAQRSRSSAVEEKSELAVAFVEFTIDGKTAETVQALTARENHDLDVAVRVSRWPEPATALLLQPITVEPERSFDLPTFRFLKPPGQPPFDFQQRGRMILHVPQCINARPFEFIYAAEFEPSSSEQPVTIAGHRTLRLDGSAANGSLETGYPGADRKLMAIRDQLRLEPHVFQSDLADLLILLKVIGNYMGQAVQDVLFPEAIGEAVFQERLKQVLRARPEIGAALEEHPHATGGITDLSFRGIRIELKSEKTARLSPDDCKRFAQQSATYEVGTNKRVSVLCVLDCAPNNAVPFPVEDGIVIHLVQTASAPIYVLTCLFQGAIPKPSSLSR